MDMELAGRVFSCIDNTTLNATDNEAQVEAFCRHTLEMGHVAAVCVYPRFVACAKRVLEGSNIRVKYVVEQGADEVDVVISRGLLLAAEDNVVRDEVAAMKQACNGRTLKVILETGELSPTLIRRASELAIDGGADFIKTSTGKITTGATLEAAEIMLNVIKEKVKISKNKVGFKAAGGIREPEEALAYAELAKKILGADYINNQTFRVGASRLTDRLYSLLTF